MLLVARRAIGRAHHAGVGLAAFAVVVAHLHRRGKSAPGAPIERRSKGNRLVTGRKAEQTAVVHLRWADDLARIEQSFGIEGVFDLLEGAHDWRSEHRLVKLRTHQAVAML